MPADTVNNRLFVADASWLAGVVTAWIAAVQWRHLAKTNEACYIFSTTGNTQNIGSGIIGP